MKLSLAFFAFAALLGYGAHAQIEFTPSDVPGYFVEQFTENWTDRWSPSQATKEEAAGEVFTYRGKWSVEEPEVYPGIPGDLGLVAKTKAAHHAISAPIATIDNKDKTLVVQYEVKLEKGLDCGGAYLKLLSELPEPEQFSDKTPYTIMFGPDKCGSAGKVHFIFRHPNPKTGEVEEKHLKTPPIPQTTDKLTHVYRLVVRPDQTFDIAIDGKSVSSGSLLESFAPPVNPPKEIDDPNDFKPADWVDEATIPDPNAKKPADWDEDAPAQIEDPDAVKPADWLDDEPLTVPDPSVEKPADWSDEDDGDWEAPSVANPKCREASGCGEWKRPLIANPAYKGKWFAPYIENPAYKGPWAPRKIANPDYFEDLTPSHFTPIKGIGFEIWTMSEDILFDNIYIGDDETAADKFYAETYAIKKPLEEEALKKDQPETPEPPIGGVPSASKDPLGFVRFHVQKFVDAAVQDPVSAVKTQPETGAALGLGLALLVALVALLVSPSKKADTKVAAEKKDVPAPADVKDTAAEAKSTAVDAAAEAADVTKRSVKKPE